MEIQDTHKLSVRELWDWAIRWWQDVVRATQVKPPMSHAVCVCTCVKLGKRRQLLICLSAGPRSACCHLFVYSQHHRQLVWDRFAITWCREHHEHSLPCVCLVSSGRFNTGAPACLKSQLCRNSLLLLEPWISQSGGGGAHDNGHLSIFTTFIPYALRKPS